MANNIERYKLTTGTSTAYVLTDYSYGVYSGGQEFYVKAHVTNTGPITIAINGTTPKEVTLNGSPLVAGDLDQNSLWVFKYSDTSDTVYLFRQESVVSDSVGGGAPAGTGFVRVTDGVYDTPGPLGATDIPALDTAKITTGQFVDGRMPTASNAATIAAISTVANAATPKSVATTKGDIFVATASATIARQGVGSNGQVLTADSAQTNGLKWATPSGGSLTTSLIAQLSSGQSLGPSPAAMLYDTPSENVGPGWSYSSGVWTCLIDGWYSVRATTYSPSGNATELRIRRNSTYLFIGPSTATQAYPCVIGTAYWQSGDTLEIHGYSGSGSGTLDVSIAGLRELYVKQVA